VLCKFRASLLSIFLADSLIIAGHFKQLPRALAPPLIEEEWADIFVATRPLSDLPGPLFEPEQSCTAHVLLDCTEARQLAAVLSRWSMLRPDKTASVEEAEAHIRFLFSKRHIILR